MAKELASTGWARFAGWASEAGQDDNGGNLLGHIDKEARAPRDRPLSETSRLVERGAGGKASLERLRLLGALRYNF